MLCAHDAGRVDEHLFLRYFRSVQKVQRDGPQRGPSGRAHFIVVVKKCVDRRGWKAGAVGRSKNSRKAQESTLWTGADRQPAGISAVKASKRGHVLTGVAHPPRFLHILENLLTK